MTYLLRPSHFLPLVALVAAAPWAAAQRVYHETPLTWDHFQGGPPADPNLDATTATGYEVNFPTRTVPDGAGGFKTKPGKVSVKPYFDSALSGKRPGPALTPALLQHEQYHFDITVVWARYLEEELAKIEGCGATPDAAKADALEKAKAAEERNKDLCNRVSLVYDLQTNHGRNAGPQAAWCAKIGAWLAKVKVAVAPTTGEGSVRVRGGGNSGNFEPMTTTLEVLGAMLDISGAAAPPQYAPIAITTLALRGFHMDGTALLGPESPDAGPAVLRIEDPAGGADLLVAHIRTMTGPNIGDLYSVWLEEVNVRDDVEVSAPGIAAIIDGLAVPEYALPTFELRLSTPIDLTSGATQNTAATTDLGLSAATDPADCDGDGVVNATDGDFFVALYYGTFPRLTHVAGDLDADGDIDILDGILLFQRIYG